MGLYEELAEERERIAYFMRRLYRMGLTTTSGGNISLRCPDGHVLLTPSALDKGELQADEILLSTMDGENLTPRFKPTLETGMHLAILRQRPDIDAVVHAHPVFGTSFACADAELDLALTSEIFMHVPKLGRGGGAPPGTKELAELTAGALADADVALMRNHGVVTVGKSLLKAFDLLEAVEVAAKMTVVTKALGGGCGLTGEQRQAMAALFRNG